MIEIWGRQIEPVNSRQDVYDAVGLITIDGQLVPECAAGEGGQEDQGLYNSLGGLFGQNGPLIEAENTLLRHLYLRRHGMSGPNDFGAMVNQNFATFQNTHFGVKVPAACLDPGIALFIKSLPLLGIHTCYSCCGHGTEFPHFMAYSSYHYSWARACLSRIFPIKEFDYILGDAGSWMRYKVQYKIKGHDAYWKLARMGRFLIDSEQLCERVRTLKNGHDLTDEIISDRESLDEFFRRNLPI